MHNKPEFNLEYNLAGGLLLTIREKDFERLMENLVDSGYKYGCILPFRALAEDKGMGNLKSSLLQIVHSEKVISVPNQTTKFPQGEWEKQFQTFQKRIEVVDIHPPAKKDAQDLLKDRGLLKELAIAAKQIGVKFLRVEIPIPLTKQLPGSPFNQKRLTFLKDIGQALREA